MNKFKILLVAGTRPNFIKLAPLYHNLKKEEDFDVKICHSGQHYDSNMSDIFWKYLELPEPDYSLGINQGAVPEIIGNTMTAISKILLSEKNFNLVIVFGDVNATVAGAISAAQSGIRLMHVEAGLRSFDRTMPEEINRIITDHISDYLMVSEDSGLKHLKKEGISPKNIFYVGNIMIECLLNTKSKWKKIKQADSLEDTAKNPFILLTFHRPENVDSPENLQKIVNIITELSNWLPVIFPVHPRTFSRLKEFNLIEKIENQKNIKICNPLGYFEFLNLIDRSELVITDSGGVQEETSFLNKACITIRKNTERPVTISLGTNLLIDLNINDFISKVKKHLHKIKSQNRKKIKYWDNKVSQRIIKVIKNQCIQEK